MKTSKNLGIWMDHATAHLMEFTTDPIETQVIESKFTHPENDDSHLRGDKTMHNKEQHQQSAYYKKLGEAIVSCDEVILFGPTHAKNELYNLLKADHLFANIKIEVKQTDKLTEHQQHAFVKEYFSKH